jgi:Uma2 family endonuclease
MQAQIAHRFTTQEYHRMAETGVLPPEARVELLDGEIFDMSPIGPTHGAVTKRLNQFFTRLGANRWLVSVQDPVHLSAHSEPQPDIMLLRPAADFYTRRHPEPKDVFLLIEVAETSLEYDRTKKLPAYARGLIPEVWIVNLEDAVLEVYREPNPTGYSSAKVLRGADSAQLLHFPDVTLKVADILKL